MECSLLFCSVLFCFVLLFGFLSPSFFCFYCQFLTLRLQVSRKAEVAFFLFFLVLLWIFCAPLVAKEMPSKIPAGLEETFGDLRPVAQLVARNF